MSYIIRTRCPNGCKYKNGYTCVASECPYQTGDVRYDIRLNAEDKPTKINEQAKQVVKEFAERLKERFTQYNNTDDVDIVASVNYELNELLKEYGK